jgi:ribosomal-protein-alanine N-acetyltransferase
VTAPPAAAVQIRRLTYADLPQVVAIERRAFASPWSLAMFVLELSKPSGICLAAEAPTQSAAGGERRGEAGDEPEARHTRDRLDGQLAGYVICSRYDQAWHVMNVAVDPDRRRRGIASALMAAVLERTEPDAQLTLEVRESNRGAIALYERFGFRSAGVRRRYYANDGEDAVIMWRTPATLRGDDPPR